jgi:DNA-binding PucR family transcriptional regulator
VPLVEDSDRGTVLRETLHAYFATARNTYSTAAALGVSRQTVGNRLRAVEERLGRSLDSCATEVEIALRLEDPGFE